VDSLLDLKRHRYSTERSTQYQVCKFFLHNTVTVYGTSLKSQDTYHNQAYNFFPKVLFCSNLNLILVQFAIPIWRSFCLYCTVRTTITGIHSVIIITTSPETNKVRKTIVLAGAVHTIPFWFISRKAAVTFAPAKNEFWAHCGRICQGHCFPVCAQCARTG
jgi:hypothetical protein